MQFYLIETSPNHVGCHFVCGHGKREVTHTLNHEQSHQATSGSRNVLRQIGLNISSLNPHLQKGVALEKWLNLIPDTFQSGGYLSELSLSLCFLHRTTIKRFDDHGEIKPEPVGHLIFFHHFGSRSRTMFYGHSHKKCRVRHFRSSQLNRCSQPYFFI